MKAPNLRYAVLAGVAILMLGISSAVSNAWGQGGSIRQGGRTYKPRSKRVSRPADLWNSSLSPKWWNSWTTGRCQVRWSSPHSFGPAAIGLFHTPISSSD